MRRISPRCPKCKGHHTYDIIPTLPNIPEIQLSKNEVQYSHEMIVGNAKYYCMDCEYIWKKYRGKKPYDRIKVIYADVGGYPGPYFHVKIDLESLMVETSQEAADLISIKMKDVSLTPKVVDAEEKFEWFRSELYKCDFINWAEEYYAYVLDGTHWSVRIEYDTHCEIKKGSNNFPAKWTKFCKAVAKVSDGEFF
ncbi:hypothetical protein ACFVV6_09980 [Bacillus mycoides]|uniref:hypothetical protein n=2 Tax=Bacillus mycoides TaxID=1405 RepID=UPI00365245D7